MNFNANFNPNNINALLYQETWETPFTAKISIANGKLATLSLHAVASSETADVQGATSAKFCPTAVGANLEIVSTVGARLKVSLSPAISVGPVPDSAGFARLNYELEPLNSGQTDKLIIANPGPLIFWKREPPSTVDRATTPENEAASVD